MSRRNLSGAPFRTADFALAPAANVAEGCTAAAIFEMGNIDWFSEVRETGKGPSAYDTIAARGVHSIGNFPCRPRLKNVS